jgi:hypothetical protein
MKYNTQQRSTDQCADPKPIRNFQAYKKEPENSTGKQGKQGLKINHLFRVNASAASFTG